jgi:hypothetical protein
VFLGAAGAILLAAQEGDGVEVVSLARPMQRGDVLAAEDLVSVGISAGARLRAATPASAQRDLLGRSLLVDLPAGTLLAPEMVAAARPAPNGVPVGLRLTPDALPAPTLRPGEWVRVVRVDPATGEAKVVAPAAEVISILQEATETTRRSADVVVYIAVPPDSADEVAGAASADRGVRLLGARP